MKIIIHNCSIYRVENFEKKNVEVINTVTFDFLKELHEYKIYGASYFNPEYNTTYYYEAGRETNIHTKPKSWKYDILLDCINGFICVMRRNVESYEIIDLTPDITDKLKRYMKLIKEKKLHYAEGAVIGMYNTLEEYNKSLEY